LLESETAGLAETQRQATASRPAEVTVDVIDEYLDEEELVETADARRPDPL
jgi:hypothetical protein